MLVIQKPLINNLIRSCFLEVVYVVTNKNYDQKILLN